MDPYGEGGGIYTVKSSSSFINCTVADNDSDGIGGGGFHTNHTSSEDTYVNSIVWGNTAADAANVLEEQILEGDPFFSVVVTYSCIQDDDPDDASIPFDATNIDDDPEFVNAAGGNYRLDNDPCSPAVDAGDEVEVPADDQDIDDDGDEDEATPDLDLTNRVIGVEVDMGAYENEPDGCNLAADVNGDGCVDVDDLIAIIVAWGACTGACPEDIDADGEVEVDDLVFVILA